VAVGLAGALILFVHLRLYPFAFDDAYIHFRIAENLARLGVPYFNPSEAVKGSTSSAWIILLAILVRIDGQLGLQNALPFEVACLNALFTVSGALVYSALLSRFSAAQSPWILYLFGLTYIAIQIRSSLGLMETSLALLVVGAGLCLLQAGKVAGFGLLGAAAFIRPEVALVLILAAFFAFRRCPGAAWRAALYSLCGMAPFVVFDFGFFGTVVAQSIVAKPIVYDLSYKDVAVQIAASLLPPSGSQPAVFVLLLALASLLGTCALAGLGVLRITPAPGSEASQLLGVDAARLVLLWGCGVLGAYAMGRTAIFSWYVPLYLVPIVMAACIVLLTSPSAAHMIALCAFGVSVVLGPFLTMWGSVEAAGGLASRVYSLNRGLQVRRYIQIGSSLYAEYPAAVLMSSEIGGLGYGFHGYVFDGAGLVSPAALKFHPLSVPDERSSPQIGAIPARLIGDFKPELVVSYDVFIEQFLGSPEANRYVHVKCPVLQRSDTGLPDSQASLSGTYLSIFIRRDVDQPARDGLWLPDCTG
jgi:hypothetical protein